MLITILIGYEGYKSMSKYIYCSGLKTTSGNLSSVIDKCNNDITCQAVIDWSCKGTGHIYMCTEFNELTNPTAQCSYVKGKNLKGNIHDINI